MDSETYLYERIKQTVTDMIQSGTLTTGDRLPSLRRMSSDMRVSISTVSQAYMELEAMGLIEARPQSGFYVTAAGLETPQPATSAPEQIPVKARRSDYYHSIVSLLADTQVVPLAAALPAPELMPGQALAACMRQALSEEPAISIGYTDIRGLPRLRSHIASHMLTKGISVGADDIIVTNGASEALFDTLRALTRPGDLVAVESPTYFGMINLLENLGLYALEIATHPLEGIEVEALGKALEQYDVKVCLLQPNFSNPLGSLYPEEKRREILKMCLRHNVPLVEDDVYGDLSHGGRCPASIAAHDDSGLAIYLSSFSKTVAAGLRVGWIVPGRFHEKILRQRVVATLASSGPSQAAMANYLASGRYHRNLKKLAAVFRDQSLTYRSKIMEYFPEGSRITDPAGGFLLWVELDGRIDTIRLYQDALRHKIAFAPGPLFTSQQRYASHMRINCGYPWNSRMEDAVRILGELAQAQL